MLACIIVALMMVAVLMVRIKKYSEIKTRDMKESGGILEEVFYSVKTVY